ncbi:hypothetical protein E7T09_02940 [Deinococcus sp. KSM4-11]|uniref:hypothetical protein n=1 Tax=Deinococcus sp. KSM4-11 TaxID=2568654 RepID=UPI0010A41773|nr:hypothetical protein [Deinococcus sp. KSM4-11]THF88183.1 hypothetical protein E7T09_02940 [Deinococcus sp. KSM4-11]
MTAPPPRPDAWTILSLVLLAALAVLLFLPLLGAPTPSPWLVAALLLVRVGVQVMRARTDERLRRPTSWAFDLLLIGLLFYTLANRPPG